MPVFVSCGRLEYTVVTMWCTANCAVSLITVWLVLFGLGLALGLLLVSIRSNFYPQRPPGQAVITGALSSPPVLAFIFIVHRVQHSRFFPFMLVDFHRILLTHPLALSVRQVLR